MAVLEGQTVTPFRTAAYQYIRDADHLPTEEEEAVRERDPLCRVKLFGGPGTWWIAGYDPDTRIGYGVAEICEREVGSFSMEELVALRIPIEIIGFGRTREGLPIERDLRWKPQRISEVLAG